MNQMDKALDILHDHHKDSFGHIREREKQRDRLFLIVIGLLGFIVLQLQYTSLGGAVEITAGGAKVDLSKVPGPAILSTSWTFLLALMLRYCQVAIHIEKQYDYLHTLEEQISKALGDDQSYHREGKAYFVKKAQAFRNWAWIAYTMIFPAIVVGAVGLSACLEFADATIPRYHKWYDMLVAAAALVSLILYESGLWQKKLTKWWASRTKRN